MMEAGEMARLEEVCSNNLFNALADWGEILRDIEPDDLPPDAPRSSAAADGLEP